MTKRKTSAKKSTPANATRDALPFYVSSKKSPTPWWTVKPSGNYTDDLETGRAYAQAFIPLLTFNVGAAALGWIVSDMARAARPAKRSDHPNARIHSIDAIATGFMLAIGGSLQSAVASIAIAAVAIKDPESDLGAKFVSMVEAGNALQPLNHSTLAHDPDACILQPADPMTIRTSHAALELAALGAKFEPLIAPYVAAHTSWAKGSKAAHAAVDAKFGPFVDDGDGPAKVRRKRNAGQFKLLKAELIRNGGDAGQRKMHALYKKMEPLAEKIIAATATTPAGFRAKTAVALWNCLPGTARADFDYDNQDALCDLLEASAQFSGLGELYACAKAQVAKI